MKGSDAGSSASGKKPLSWPAIRNNLGTPGRRLGAFLLIFAAAGLVFLLGYALYALWKVPSVDGLDRASFSQATVLYASDGSEISRYYEKNRTWVPLDSVSQETVEALVATEDRRFYDHWGIDIRRTVGAGLQTLTGDPQGGSTLTMQLVRNVFPRVQDDFIFTRKMKEWLTALRIEAQYSKDQILEVYLNTVPFMYNAFGIEAAAQTYFSKSAINLTAPEAATLVGMLKGTTFYNPVRNPERSQERRNVVLEQMAEAGYLSSQEVSEMQNEPLSLDFQRITHEENRAPYFAEHVRQWLDDWAGRRGYNPYTDGLKVYTTLDLGYQQAAENAVKEEARKLQAVADVSWSASSVPFFSSNGSAYLRRQPANGAFDYFWRVNDDVLSRLIRRSERYRKLTNRGTSGEEALDRLLNDPAFVDSLKDSSTRLEAGFVAIDPETGHVRAWVGGRNYEDDKYDHVALAKRQPGSTFKPFVYGAALENGYSPNDILLDRKVTYTSPATGKEWSPGNFGRETGQPIPLRQALARNCKLLRHRLQQFSRAACFRTHRGSWVISIGHADAFSDSVAPTKSL